MESGKFNLILDVKNNKNDDAFHVFTFPFSTHPYAHLETSLISLMSIAKLEKQLVSLDNANGHQHMGDQPSGACFGSIFSSPLCLMMSHDFKAIL